MRWSVVVVLLAAGPAAGGCAIVNALDTLEDGADAEPGDGDVKDSGDGPSHGDPQPGDVGDGDGDAVPPCSGHDDCFYDEVCTTEGCLAPGSERYPPLATDPCQWAWHEGPPSARDCSDDDSCNGYLIHCPEGETCACLGDKWCTTLGASGCSQSSDCSPGGLCAYPELRCHRFLDCGVHEDCLSMCSVEGCVSFNPECAQACDQGACPAGVCLHLDCGVDTGVDCQTSLDCDGEAHERCAFPERRCVEPVLRRW